MRKLIVSVLMASTFAVAAPAAAQYQRYDDNRYGYQQGAQQLQQQIYQLRERIGRVTQRGAVSRGEANRLQRELYQIERRYNQFARNGIDRREQYDLQQRIQNLRQQIREDRQDGRRYDNDRYGNDGRYNDDRRYNDNRGYNDDRRYDRRDRDDDDDDDD